MLPFPASVSRRAWSSVSRGRALVVSLLLWLALGLGFLPRAAPGRWSRPRDALSLVAAVVAAVLPFVFSFVTFGLYIEKLKRLV